jgi:hypothetical protein
MKDHLSEITVSPPETVSSVYEDLAQTMLPDDRPLWHVTLIHDTLADQDLIVFQAHHAIGDGLCFVQMMNFLFDLELREATKLIEIKEKEKLRDQQNRKEKSKANAHSTASININTAIQNVNHKNNSSSSFTNRNSNNNSIEAADDQRNSTGDVIHEDEEEQDQEVSLSLSLNKLGSNSPIQQQNSALRQMNTSNTATSRLVTQNSKDFSTRSKESKDGDDSSSFINGNNQSPGFPGALQMVMEANNTQTNFSHQSLAVDCSVAGIGNISRLNNTSSTLPLHFETETPGVTSERVTHASGTLTKQQRNRPKVAPQPLKGENSNKKVLLNPEMLAIDIKSVKKIAKR